MIAPTLRRERELMRQGARRVCGMDEVGRGALAGPVSVGAVVVAQHTPALPGVRDSKLLAPATRTALVPRIHSWAVAYAVGHASPAEIDEVGLIAAMRRAGMRALQGLALSPDVILLDGSHDWLTPPGQASFFEMTEEPEMETPPVTMMVKADLSCTSVAAASVLAKVERDGLLVSLSKQFPDYGWEQNKGYSSAEHHSALERIGACEQHRRTWRLGIEGD